MIVLQKRGLYESVFKRHSAWEKMRGAEADGNSQPSDSYDDCSETLSNHSSKGRVFF